MRSLPDTSSPVGILALVCHLTALGAQNIPGLSNLDMNWWKSSKFKVLSPG